MDVLEKRQERVVERGEGEGEGGPGNGIRGATGGGNVGLGNASGTTTVTSLTTNIGNNNAAATTVNVGNTGTSMFGTVNVGMGATAVNIGTNVGGVITIGNTGGTARFNGPITLGSAPSSAGTTGSAPYLGTYYFNNTIPAFANTATNLCTITISVPGVYIVTLGVQLQLTSSTPTNNYINALTNGMTTIGFSQIYSTWFQSANASFVVYVGTTYSATVNMNNASSSLISTNGITCQWGYVRIA